MSEHITDFLSAVVADKPVKAFDAFSQAIKEKVELALEAKYEQVSKGLFGEELELDEAKMSDAEVLKAAKALAANGKDAKAKKFGQGLVDFYNKNDSFTPDQVAGLQNIMKNASFQMAKED